MMTPTPTNASRETGTVWVRTVPLGVRADHAAVQVACPSPVLTAVPPMASCSSPAVACSTSAIASVRTPLDPDHS